MGCILLSNFCCSRKEQAILVESFERIFQWVTSKGYEEARTVDVSGLCQMPPTAFSVCENKVLLYMEIA